MGKLSLLADTSGENLSAIFAGASLFLSVSIDV